MMPSNGPQLQNLSSLIIHPKEEEKVAPSQQSQMPERSRRFSKAQYQIDVANILASQDYNEKRAESERSL